MHVGLTGGTGNLSRPFVEALLAEGHTVTCFNRSGQVYNVAASEPHNLRTDEKKAHPAATDALWDRLAEDARLS